MGTLTETAYYTRKGINIFIVSVIAFFVLRASVHTAIDIWNQLRPKSPEKPTLAFGVLSKIKFPDQGNQPQNLQMPEQIKYRLETIDASLPAFPTIGRVYFMPGNSPRLLALDRAKDRAKAIGFSAEPQMISGNIFYRWRNAGEPASFLEMDTSTTHFKMHYFYDEDSTLINAKNVPGLEGATSEAKDYLSKGNFLNSELADGKGEIIYYNYVPPDFFPAPAISEANFARLNLFRSDLDDLRILPPNPKKSLVTFLISGVGSIVEAEYICFPLEREIFATYPLKPIDQAWQELQDNQGYLAYLGDNPQGEIIIRKVSMAYFDSEEKQGFLQPIYVFEGDRDFFGYVSAISPEWAK